MYFGDKHISNFQMSTISDHFHENVQHVQQDLINELPSPPVCPVYVFTEYEKGQEAHKFDLCEALNLYYNHTPELRTMFYQTNYENRAHNHIRIAKGVENDFFTFYIGLTAYKARVYNGNRLRFRNMGGHIIEKKKMKIDLVTEYITDYRSIPRY